MKLKPIGRIRAPYLKRSDCPKQGYEEGLPAEIVLEEQYLSAANGLSPGQELLVLTWLHQGDRAVLECHPRGDRSLPRKGVFATRSPDRPNPVGLHRVRLMEIVGSRLLVHPLEVVDGTTVLDIKPVLGREAAVAWGEQIQAEEGELLKQTGRAAWQKGLLSGFNGNLSLKSGQRMIITASGSVKGRLAPGDLVCLDLAGGHPYGPVRMSSETPMHLALYRAQSLARAIVHTHPVHLLALDLASKGSPLDLPLFEAGLFRELFIEVEPIRPGSEQLARAVAQAARKHRAVFLRQHGLVCWEENLTRALALSEELEALAEVKLKGGIEF